MRSAALLIALSAALLGSAPPAAPASSFDWTDEGGPRVAAVQHVGVVAGALFASTWTEGTWRSEDAGASWSAVPAFPPVTKGRFAADPTDAQVLYLAGFGGVARTTDGGTTWSQVLAVQRAARVDVSLSGRVVVGARYADASNHVLVSDDRGATWQDLGAPLPPGEPICGVAFAPHDGWVLVQTDDRSWYTHDGGATWVETPGAGFEFAIEDTGVVWRAAAFDLERTTDGGVTWQDVEAPGYGIAVGPHPAGGLYLAGTAGLLLTRDGGATWQQRGFAGAMKGTHGVLADPRDPDAAFVTDERRGVARIAPDGLGGFTHEGFSLGRPPPLAYLAASGALAFAGGASGVWVSRDQSATWRHTGAATDGITALAAAGMRAYAAVRDVQGLPVVEVSADGGRRFAPVALPGGPGVIVALAAGGPDGASAWAAVQGTDGWGRVFRTTDAGASWEARLELPLLVHDLALAADSPWGVLAGTGVGTLAHMAGAWIPLGGGPPATSVAAAGGEHVAASGLGPSVWRGRDALPSLLPWADAGPVADLHLGPRAAWVTTADGRLLFCAGEGGECTDLSPPARARSAIEEPATKRLVAATDQGLWQASR